jgi:hypothetical protein
LGYTYPRDRAAKSRPATPLAEEPSTRSSLTRTSRRWSAPVRRPSNLQGARRCRSCGNCFACDGCLGTCPEDTHEGSTSARARRESGLVPVLGPIRYTRTPGFLGRDPGSTVERCNLLSVSRYPRVSGAELCADSGPAMAAPRAQARACARPFIAARLKGLASSVRVRADAFRAVVEAFPSRQPCADEFEVADRSMQDTARITLRRHPEVNDRWIGVGRSSLQRHGGVRDVVASTRRSPASESPPGVPPRGSTPPSTSRGAFSPSTTRDLAVTARSFAVPGGCLRRERVARRGPSSPIASLRDRRGARRQPWCPELDMEMPAGDRLKDVRVPDLFAEPVDLGLRRPTPPSTKNPQRSTRSGAAHPD